MGAVNNNTLNIKLTHVYSEVAVDFLDVHLEIDNHRRIQADVFRKSTSGLTTRELRVRVREHVRDIGAAKTVTDTSDLKPIPQHFLRHHKCNANLLKVRMARDSNPSWKPIFIVKPDGGCQGDGIYLIKDPCEVRGVGGLQSRPAVVQEYVRKPLLVDKLKFDMRLYVVLTSLEPLEIYISHDGLSRFCTEPYQQPTHKNLHRSYMHLTNYSLNIHSGNFIHSDSAHTGSKRTVSSVLCRLLAKGMDIRKILGFDVLLLKNLKPVLLEVNANPSMKIEHEQELLPGVYENVPSPVDEEVKVAVIRDTLRLVDPGRRRSSQKPSPSLDTMTDFHTEPTDSCNTDTPTRPEKQNLPPLCLKQVYPKYARKFCHLRVLERVATLFIRFLGVKGSMRMGPTGFRTFIRSCKLSGGSFSMASGDILYIDITRRWSNLEHRESGMCLQAFFEAFFHLARRQDKGLVFHEQVQSLVEFCYSQLDSMDEKRLLCSRALVERGRQFTTSRRTDVHVTSYTPLVNCSNASCKLTDYKLQHS
ncbi:unnamed protein product [Ranitomeya imitator]|uniref:Tubulin polyglutamylase TTLL11 n=1 Tax=Ranitomeya imitator TaxID=111125 RepID=A0ABN9LF70_9NEOB|nr:unnamed protein product [Ranitomeya imitator]